MREAVLMNLLSQVNCTAAAKVTIVTKGLAAPMLMRPQALARRHVLPGKREAETSIEAMIRRKRRAFIRRKWPRWYSAYEGSSLRVGSDFRAKGGKQRPC
jgi:hypothetical protein